MGRLFLVHLNKNDKSLACNTCNTILSSNDEIISKNFHGRGGTAYLMNNVLNTYTGPSERRILMTGLHIVADLYCSSCHSLIGWKYEEAYEQSEKYKEGKFILEKSKITKPA
jgi:hypothetical protein